MRIFGNGFSHQVLLVAQQALSTAQQALSQTNQHMHDCERREDDRTEREAERDKRLEAQIKLQDTKVDLHHQQNLGNFETLRNEAKTRGYWIIGLLITTVVTMGVFIVENHR